MSFIYNMADTWNAVGTTFSGILMNVSNGAGAVPVGAVTSQLVNVQTNGTQNFGVRMPHFVLGTDSSAFLNLADTWNTSGNPTGILYNATNTASGATTKLMDLQVGAVSQFNVTKAGATTQTGVHNLATGTNVIAPLQYTSGTNLTSAVAGAREFDGVQHYATMDTTSGRAAIASEQYFHLTGNGGVISTIANFFGTTSNISLVASAHYIIDAEMWFTVQTGTQTVVWTLTNSAAPTSQNIDFEMSPTNGMIAPPGTATMLRGQIQGDATATKALTATGALTNAITVYTRMRIWLINGTGTSLKIQATSSANTITPLTGSWWRCRRMSPNNIGTFAA